MPDNEASYEDPRTLHAQQALAFSEIFAYRFDKLPVGRVTPRTLKLMDVDNVSTQGGKQARQSLVLQPEQDKAGSIVCGWVDVPQRLAEVRTYHFVKQQFEARYKKSIDFIRDDYDRVLEALFQFFKLQRIEHRMIESAPLANGQDKEDDSTTKIRSSMMLLMLAVGVSIGVIAGYIAWLLSSASPS